jgi:hypothetical protein
MLCCKNCHRDTENNYDVEKVIGKNDARNKDRVLKAILSVLKQGDEK